MQPLARLDKGGVLEAAVLARLCIRQRVRAAATYDEIGPVEMHRPFLAAADDDRRNASGLDLLRRGEEIVPGLDVFGLYAGLSEQLLVIEEDNLAGVLGNTVGFAVDLKRLHRGRRDRVRPRRSLGAYVLKEAGLRLRAHHAGPSYRRCWADPCRIAAWSAAWP